MTSVLRNLSLSKKIYGLAVGLLLIALTIAAVGRLSIGWLYDDVLLLKSTTSQSFSSSRGTSNLLAYARNVEFLPLEMPAESRQAFEAAAQAELAKLKERIALIREDGDATDAADLAAVEKSLAAYAPIHVEVQKLSREGKFGPAGDLAFKGAALIGEMRTHFRAIEDRKEALVEERVASVANTKSMASWEMGIVAIVGLLIGIAVSFLLVRMIVGPVMVLTKAAEKLAGGDDEVQLIDDGRKDEIGRLQLAMVALRKTVSDAFRLQQMVDDMPLAVMLADPKDNFKITYANKSTVSTMRPLEHLLPVKADGMIGQSVDIFHKNPSHQHQILKDPSRLPWKAKIKLGTETLDLRIAPVRDRKGNYVGAMLNWSVITQQIRLTDEFERTVKAVVETVASASTELESSAQALSATAEETNRQSTVVAAAAEQASANVQTVASAAEELSSSISEISQQVLHSSRIAAKGAEEAQETRRIVDGLAQTAGKIGDVVNLINAIASQTNLLALNATIEAARAGEAGKGFAVVASEVKALAQQTQKATEEIATQVSAIQHASNGSVSAIRRIADVIAEVNEIAAAISAAVEEQGAATKEIARNVEQAATGTQEVSANIIGVTQAAGESGSAATQVAGSAGELSQQSAMLSQQVDKFLQMMRAA